VVVWGVFGIEAPVNEEEQDQAEKLTRRERRAQGKGGDGSNEVRDRNERLRREAALQRRKKRADERADALGEGLATGERVDDALVRSADAAGKFVRSQFVWIQWVIVLGLAGGVFYMVNSYRTSVAREKHGHVVGDVLATVLGKVTSEETVPARDPRLVDTRPEFANADERSLKSLEAWRGLKGDQSSELKATARLGAANALYDLRKYDEAIPAYQALLNDKSVQILPLIKLRALEGVGFCLEAQGKLTEALTAFTQLTSLDDKADKQLGRFHMARVHHLLKQDDEAKKLLTELNDQLSKDAPAEGPEDYLGAAVRDLLRTVDPAFAIKERQELAKKQSEEQAKRLAEMIEEMKKRNGNFSLPGEPNLPLPAPMDLEQGDAPEPPPAPAPASAAPAAAAPAPVGSAPSAPAGTSPKPAATTPATGATSTQKPVSSAPKPATPPSPPSAQSAPAPVPAPAAPAPAPAPVQGTP